MKFKDFLLNELFEAYWGARIGGKRKTEDEHRFEVNDLENLVRLRDTIVARAYHPSRGVAFIIHDPVAREIFAAPFVDRVVHHFLFKYSDMWWESRLSPASYSCRKGKGTLYGIKDLQRKMRRVSENGTKTAYVVKRDLQGYFMSLDHQKLYKRILWGLNRQFPNGGELYRTLKYLWREIIFDDPCEGVTIRGRKSDWDVLPPEKSLFNQLEGRGLVIGNLTSQQLSNIFLDQLDRFITITLGYKNYGRYVDDFFIVVSEADFPRLILEDMPKIERFISSLGLTIHPRKQSETPVKNGVEFLGAKVFRDHIVPGERISKNFADAIYRLATTGEGKISSISSYDGHLAHYSSHKLIKHLYDGVGWDYPYPKLPSKQKPKQKPKQEPKPKPKQKSKKQ
jgi:RNA-directed DNA polymerase